MMMNEGVGVGQPSTFSQLTLNTSSRVVGKKFLSICYMRAFKIWLSSILGVLDT